jgi:hypothetical protein
LLDFYSACPLLIVKDFTGGWEDWEENTDLGYRRSTQLDLGFYPGGDVCTEDFFQVGGEIELLGTEKKTKL